MNWLKLSNREWGKCLDFIGNSGTSMAGCGLSFCHLQVSQECGPGGWISELLTPVRYFAGLWAAELSKSLKHTSSKMSPGAWCLVLRLIWHLWLSKHWTSTCWGSAISQALSIAGDTCLKLTVPASHSTHPRKGKYWAVKWIKQRRPALIEVQMRSDPHSCHGSTFCCLG